MSIKLENLRNTTTKRKRRKIVGRGPSSGHGKTSCRGHKGAASRSGYKVRAGTEGGGVPLYRRLPTRGFSNARFAKRFDVINLEQIEKIYDKGEIVSLETLRKKGFIRGFSHGIKVLGKGDLSKQVSFDVASISSGAKEKLEKAKISV